MLRDLRIKSFLKLNLKYKGIARPLDHNLLALGDKMNIPNIYVS